MLSCKVKKGISLVILVITIIVIAIVSVAIIVSVSNTNIMSKTDISVFKSDMQSFKEKYNFWLADKIISDNVYNTETINYVAKDTYLLNTILGGKVPEKYQNGLMVEKGKLVYFTNDVKLNLVLEEIGMLPENFVDVANPYNSDEWQFAWWYSETSGWSEKLTDGTPIPSSATIIAKVYENGNRISPVVDGDTYDEGNAYDLVIEGAGVINMQNATNAVDREYYGWLNELMTSSNTESIIALYITKVIVTNGITGIGTSAFRYCCSLEEATISNSVTSIGDYSFDECINLTTIELPNTLTSIGDEAFANCIALYPLTIPSSVASIGEDAFQNVPHIYYSGSVTEGSPWGALAIN